MGCSVPADVAKRLTMTRERVLWTQWGEHARSILRQYNQIEYWTYRFQGPHYVQYIRGEFRLIPFGAYADDRYSFECRPEFIPGVEEPLWTFMVA